MKDIQLNKEKALALIKDLESEIVERTISTSDTNKFAQAICAFSNDLSNTAKNGYLIIGVHDNGELSGLKVTDRFLQNLGGLRSDGNVLPQPIISIQPFSFDKGDVVIIEVQPSPFPPVRYKGKTWIRVGPRKAVANEMEERVLTERRSNNVSMFDMRPCIEASLDDLDVALFKNTYLPRAIDKELLQNDTRDIPEQMAALRFYSIKHNCPTFAGILLFGKKPEFFIPGGYIQYVEFKGESLAGDIMNEKKFSGNLISMLQRIETFIDDAIISQRPVPISTLKEKKVKNYPNWAIRELMMNAVMHRDYESNAPIKFYRFDDRIEISNAGGLFGKARPENFPNENDYRNPTLAESMKVLGYVNRFNRGIARVQEELKKNGSKKAVFDYHRPGAFSVCVKDALFAMEKNNRPGDSLLSTSSKTSTETENTSSKTSREIIFEALKGDNTLTAHAIAEKLELTEKGVRYHLDILKKEGLIEHVGPSKKGKWIIKNQKDK